MAVRLVVVGTEARHDHIRPESANLPDDVGKNFIAIPNAQSFLRAFRKAEINRAREKLVAMIETARGEKFLGAYHSETHAKLRPVQVLVARAARECMISGYW